MEELGIIITPSGKVIKFGKYACTMYRDNENQEHFHAPAFKKIAKENPEEFSFIKDIEKFDITAKLEIMASNDYITLLNTTSGAFTPSIPTCLMVSPENLSKEQQLSLLKESAKLLYFDQGLAYIDILDKESNIIEEITHLPIFFDKYLGIKVNSFLDSIPGFNIKKHK